MTTFAQMQTGKCSYHQIQALLKSETKVHEAQGIMHIAFIHGQKRIIFQYYYHVNYLTYF